MLGLLCYYYLSIFNLLLILNNYGQLARLTTAQGKSSGGRIVCGPFINVDLFYDDFRLVHPVNLCMRLTERQGSAEET